MAAFCIRLPDVYGLSFFINRADNTLCLILQKLSPELFILGVQANNLYNLKSGKKCKKTRPIHILRNHVLVFQFFYIVLHAFYTEATCLNVHRLTYMECTIKPLTYLKAREKTE